MLKEALELIQETARKAQEIRPLGPTADGRTERFDVRGELKEFAVPPANRLHNVEALVDLIDYAKTAANPVVWHSRFGVQLVLDDTERRDFVLFGLTLTRQYMRLENLEAPGQPEPFTQRGLLNFLRLELAVPAEKVALFRKVDWTQRQRTASEVQRGQESLGKEIHAECAGDAGLPEELRVEIPVYREFGEREVWSVRLAIEIDVANQQFYVCPVPGDTDTAVQHAQMSISERLNHALREKHVPIYYGSP